jgi:tetratricopeptide (TPR) repeat protein
MNTTQAARAGCLLTAIAVTTTWGCATTAELPLWRPAEANVVSVRQLAVFPFGGPDNVGPAAREACLTRLSEHGYYQLVDFDEVQRLWPAPLVAADGRVDRVAAVEAARRRQLDAIVLGQVRYERDKGHSLGSTELVLGNPTVRADVAYELIDVRTGETLAAGEAGSQYTGDLTNDRNTPTSKSTVRERLARQSGAQVGDRITPHAATIHVPLADAGTSRGAWAVRRGNKLAAEGRWSEAEQEWQAALAANPQCHAAIYNLGVAHESRQEYQQARTRYAAAHELAAETLYENGQQRVDRAHREQPLVLAQLQRVGVFAPPALATHPAAPLPPPPVEVYAPSLPTRPASALIGNP